MKKIRYPILWEKHQPEPFLPADFSQSNQRLSELRRQGIEVIAGLVHHGSGPVYVNILDESFVTGLETYARSVAEAFPWIEYYTPVNEPLTTARFCGLYGTWYPHRMDNSSFCRILINECRATVLAMKQIRTINPKAKLVQTDDLGKIHSTPLLQYQADFENCRRWLSFDLLCGKVTVEHALWNYLINSGIGRDELELFTQNACPPDILGLNHYLTSERYLDENLSDYPVQTYGGNGRDRYADVEAVRVGSIRPDGPYLLLSEAWARYRLPMAVTEVHLYCSREEQMRWLALLWDTAMHLKAENVDIRAITAWALLGSFGWNRLLTAPHGEYEPGTFDLRNKELRPTALAQMVKSYSTEHSFYHPVLDGRGWWQRQNRVLYGVDAESRPDDQSVNSRPLLIIGKTGTLGQAIAHVCKHRGIFFRLLDRQELDITRLSAIEKMIHEYNPWAIINAAGFVRVDEAEADPRLCFAVNTQGPINLARICSRHGIKLLTYSSDLVFDGTKAVPYTEHDKCNPLSIYGHSKLLAEQQVLEINPEVLVIRTSAFFGPLDQHNFIQQMLRTLRRGQVFQAISDVTISPTYLPDLVNTSLDLLLDNEAGIWHLSNEGQISWVRLAYTVAERSYLDTGLIHPQPLSAFGYPAKRPVYSVLGSRKGSLLPPLDNAIDRFLNDPVTMRLTEC